MRRFFSAAAITVGKRIPDVKNLKVVKGGEISTKSSDELFKQGKVILSGLPGCFTPTCSNVHVPSLLKKQQEFTKKGVKDIIVVTVNDPFVTKAWAENLKAQSITLVADWDGSLTRSLGLELDLTAAALGKRTQRFSAIVEDGQVKAITVDEPGVCKTTHGDEVFKHL